MSLWLRGVALRHDGPAGTAVGTCIADSTDEILGIGQAVYITVGGEFTGRPSPGFNAAQMVGRVTAVTAVYQVPDAVYSRITTRVSIEIINLAAVQRLSQGGRRHQVAPPSMKSDDPLEDRA